MQEFILLENVAAKFRHPCILDLKMGTRVHGDEVTEAKKQRHMMKCSNFYIPCPWSSNLWNAGRIELINFVLVCCVEMGSILSSNFVGVGWVVLRILCRFNNFSVISQLEAGDNQSLKSETFFLISAMW